MVEILEKLAGMNALAEIEPVAWQLETRQDRSLPQFPNEMSC